MALKTLATRAVQLILGLGLGVVLTECAFTLRDDAAFPHVNFYVSDIDRGVRLRPHSHQYIAFGGNPTTSIATNSSGYRTPEWPEGDGGILVVGDSQVFGLGVETEHTTPAQLGTLTGQRVLNGGVPTYGPDEYLDVVAEVAASRQLDAVVVVFNFGNDLFEVGRPNRDRHRVWDGWAVRAETNPSKPVQFPGRAWLFSRSHTVFALRSWWHTPRGHGQGLPSEGGIEDILGAAATVAIEQAQRETDLESLRKSEQEAYIQALDELGHPEDLVKVFLQLEIGSGRHDDLKLQAVENGNSVGDIVSQTYAESSRRIEVTADILQEGARIRRNIRQHLYREMVNQPDSYEAREIRRALNAGFEIDPSIATDSAHIPWSSPLDGPLDRLLTLSETHGFDPVVVALPLDVQVLPSQFAKYDTPPKDMEASRILLDDLATAARQRGIRVVEPLDALREAGDGAFLQRDLHLSQRGHRVVAERIAATLAAPAPVPPPRRSIHEKRSLIPNMSEWTAAREIRVTHSTRNQCATRKIREWFRMDCVGAVTGMRIVDAPLETHGWYGENAAVIVAPVLQERPVRIDVIWPDRTERLNLQSKGGKLSAGFEPAPSVAPQEGVSASGTWLAYPPGNEVLTRDRATWIGAGTRCAPTNFESCALGNRSNMPSCPPGFANAGSAGHCFALCNDETPCASGICSPWSGSSVCL